MGHLSSSGRFLNSSEAVSQRFRPHILQVRAQLKVAEREVKEQALQREAAQSELNAATARANDADRKLEEAQKQLAHLLA